MLAHTALSIIQNGKYGCYHGSISQLCTWFGRQGSVYTLPRSLPHAPCYMYTAFPRSICLACLPPPPTHYIQRSRSLLGVCPRLVTRRNGDTGYPQRGICKPLLFLTLFIPQKGVFRIWPSLGYSSLMLIPLIFLTCRAEEWVGSKSECPL